jgi:hypothetical protein
MLLDMHSSESPTYGDQEGGAYNGHFGCTCYHPLFVFDRLGAKVVSHRRYVAVQMAEVAMSRQMFNEILSLIARLRAPPAPA